MCFECEEVDDNEYLKVERDYLGPLLLCICYSVNVVCIIFTLDSLAQKHQTA